MASPEDSVIPLQCVVDGFKVGRYVFVVPVLRGGGKHATLINQLVDNKQNRKAKKSTS
jgi:hypothetical protein